MVRSGLIARTVHARMGETLELGRSLAALVAVLALVGVVAFVANLLRQRLHASGKLAGRRLELVETLPVDSRSRLALVRLDSRELLVAVGPNGIQQIATATGDDDQQSGSVR